MVRNTHLATCCKHDTVPWWSHFSYFCLQMSTSYLTSGVIQMVKGLKTGTNLPAEFASSIRCKCPFFHVALSSHKSTTFSLKHWIINCFPLTLVGAIPSTKKNNKYRQYADFERGLFPLTFCSEQKVAY